MKNFDVSDVNIKGLRLLARIAELGSLSAAAAEAGISQSSASHSLERLRELTGSKLFVRVGRGIEPTAELTNALPRIRRIIADVEGLFGKNEFDAFAFQGQYVLAANITETTWLMSEFLNSIETLSPMSGVRLVDMRRSQAGAYFEENEIDIGLSVRIGNYDSRLQHELVFHDELVTFIDRDFAPKNLMVEDFMEFDHGVLDFGGKGLSLVDLALSDLNVTRSIKYRAPNSAVLSDLVRGRPVMVTLPKSLSKNHFREFEVFKAPLSLPSIVYDLIWLRRNSDSAKNLWLREVFKGAVRRARQENWETRTKAR